MMITKKMKKYKSSGNGPVLIRVILFLYSLIVLLPLIWTIISSFKTNIEFYQNPWGLPEEMRFVNYTNALIQSKMIHHFLNSVIVVAGSSALSVFLAVTTAFAFAYYSFKGKKVIWFIYISSMMVPSILVLVHQFFIFHDLGLTNSLFGLMLAYALSPGALCISILLLVGFYKQVPTEIYSSASIDGCSDFRKMTDLAIPLIIPGIVIVLIKNSILFWNEYVVALTFITKEQLYTVPIGLKYLEGAMQYRVDFGALFAGLTLAMLPTVVIYLLLNKKIQESLSISSGSKG